MRLLILVLVLLHPNLAHADLFDDRMATLGEKTEMTARFTEYWYASYLEEAVKTTGYLHYIAPQKLIKNVTGSEPAEYVIDGDIMTIRREDESQTIDISNHPELGVGFYALRMILSGDREGLEKKFATQYRVDDSNPEKWIITLVPNDKNLAREVTKIIVAGNNSYMKEINILYANGDKLVTQITNDD